MLNSFFLLLDYFKRVAEKIPDDYVRGSIIKYVCMKDPIGTYMNQVLSSSRKVFEEDYQEENPQLEMPKEVEENNNKEEGSDIILAKPEEPQEEAKKVEKKPKSFFQKVFKIGESKEAAPSVSNPSPQKGEKIDNPASKYDKSDIQAFNSNLRKLAPYANFTVQLDAVKDLCSEKVHMINKVIKIFYVYI